MNKFIQEYINKKVGELLRLRKEIKSTWLHQCLLMMEPNYSNNLEDLAKLIEKDNLRIIHTHSFEDNYYLTNADNCFIDKEIIYFCKFKEDYKECSYTYPEFFNSKPILQISKVDYNFHLREYVKVLLLQDLL